MKLDTKNCLEIIFLEINSFTLFTSRVLVKLMIVKTIIIVGTITTILGIIFHLQGQSIVGPESSFMYSNPNWVTYGLQILVFGIILVGMGIGLFVFKRR